MVADACLRNQGDEICRSRDDDKSLVALVDKQDVDHQQGNSQQQLDAFVDKQPSETVGLLVHILLHQMAVEGAQDHLEVGACNHPVVPPRLVGTETKQYAVQDDADQQEDR